MRAIFAILGIWAALLCGVTSASAGVCDRIYAPTTITSPGHYCLANSPVLGPGVDGILIASHGVFLDLNGYTLTGPGGLGTGSGVRFSSGAYASKVYNGTIRGFMYGIRADSNRDIYVHGVDASNNTFRGFKIFGLGAHIEHSKVENIAGYPGYPDSFAMGIEVSGIGCVVQSNTIGNITPRGVGEGIGISLSRDGAGCQIHDNLVRAGDSAVTYGRTFGIWVGYSPTATVHDNVLIGADYGALGDPAVDFSDNYTDTSCGVWMTYQTAPGCLDTESYIAAKTVAEPANGSWWFRLGVIHHEQLGDTATALIHWDHACSLGQQEACRVAARTRAN